jgi:HK97 family phage prohead protease
VEPEGVVFRGPVKLHLYHKHDMPVGLVNFGKATKAGIPFEAHLPEVKEAGVVRERVNEAIHSLKYKLLDAVSIGFNVLEDGIELLKSGGYRFTKWEMLELSLVGVPANPDAVITAFKSADVAAIRRSLGLNVNGGISLIKAPQQKAERCLSGGVRLKTR